MTVLQQVNDKSTIWLTATFTDKDGNLVQPTGITWRIDSDLTQVKDWTAITPGTSVEIEIDAEYNELLNTRLELEIRTVAVKATYGVGDEHNEQYQYLVKNFHGVT